MKRTSLACNTRCCGYCWRRLRCCHLIKSTLTDDNILCVSAGDFRALSSSCHLRVTPGPA